MVYISIYMPARTKSTLLGRCKPALAPDSLAIPEENIGKWHHGNR
jgi:hypothetical protein